MKILAFTDLHGSSASLKQIEKKAKEADLIVCAGDFTNFEQHMDIIAQKLDVIGKKILMIPGNHETEEGLKEVCSLSKNLIYLHKKTYEINNYLFVGYGGGGFSLTDKEFEDWSKKIKIKFKNKKIVLITHAPPYNTKIDMIDKEPHGNKSIRKFIETFKPVLAISGHLHECVGEDKLNNTKLVNPGPNGKIIEI